MARLGSTALTDAEARVAKVVGDHYPEAALLSARGLAEAAGVSPASVSRFARKLGYSDFSDLQAALAVEMRARLSTPPGRLSVAPAGRHKSVETLFAEVVARDSDNIESTRQMVNTADLDRLAAILCRFKKTRVYVTGSKKGGIVAAYFAHQLAQLRAGVRLLALTDVLSDELLDMTSDDLLVVFEPRRATAALIRLVEHARDVGATTAAFTDEHPPATISESDLVFRTRVDAVSVFDSYAAMFAICDALLAHIVQRMPKAVRDRAELLESINTRFATWYTGRASSDRRQS